MFTRDPIVVEFHEHAEFLAELAHHETFSFNCIRVTCLVEGAGHFRQLSIVAGAIVAAGGLMLRLRKYVGELTGLDGDAKVHERSVAISRQIHEAADARKIAVRPGIYNLDRSR